LRLQSRSPGRRERQVTRTKDRLGLKIILVVAGINE